MKYYLILIYIIFYLLFHLSKYAEELIKYDTHASKLNLNDAISDLMS